MRKRQNNRGFSLTEVLMAVGILGIGMIFIAGVFPVGVYFTTIATERTIAAVAADEAFAKIRLYAVGGPDPNDDINLSKLDVDKLIRLNKDTFPAAYPESRKPFPGEFSYPSTITNPIAKQYYWFALFRRVDLSSSLVQVTVFVSRKIGAGTTYWNRHHMTDKLEKTLSLMPIPVRVWVSQPATVRADELLIIDLDASDGVDVATFINDGYTIVDNRTGQIYRVLERYADEPNKILLDRNWRGVKSGGWIRVVPPPVGGGRCPCIAIYQKVIRF